MKNQATRSASTANCPGSGQGRSRDRICDRRTRSQRRRQGRIGACRRRAAGSASPKPPATQPQLSGPQGPWPAPDLGSSPHNEPLRLHLPWQPEPAMAWQTCFSPACQLGQWIRQTAPVRMTSPSPEDHQTRACASDSTSAASAARPAYVELPGAAPPTAGSSGNIGRGVLSGPGPRVRIMRRRGALGRRAGEHR